MGCVEPNLPGKFSQWSSSGHYNLASAVEFALTNGVHLKSGRRLGMETGDPSGFESYDQFEAAVLAQIKNQIRHFTVSNHILETLHQELLPMPLASALMLDCIAEGRDLMRGGARYTVGPGTNGVGAADMANSLAALKKLVLEDKAVSMQSLVEAVKCDFQGYEDLRERLDLSVPKWGNDDDYVDQNLIRIMDAINHYHHGLHGVLGSEMMPYHYPVSFNVPHGQTVSALPSGHRAHRPLPDRPCHKSAGRELHMGYIFGPISDPAFSYSQPIQGLAFIRCMISSEPVYLVRKGLRYIL